MSDGPRYSRHISRTSIRFGWIAVGLLVCLIAAPTTAQEPTVEPGQTPRPKVEGPVVRDVPEEVFVRLNKDLDWFKVVTDGPFRLRGQDEKLPDELAEFRGQREMDAYNYVLHFASDKPLDMLRRQSAKDVPFSNLLAPVRSDYYRDLLHYKGTIRRLQALKPTDDLRRSGIQQLYEAWMVPDGHSNVLCLVVTELPAGVAFGEDLYQRAAFDAYYFKFYHYESGEKRPDGKGNQWKSAPLFLGRSFEPLPPLDDGPVFTGTMLAGVLGGLSAIVLTAVALGLWFRRGDRHVKTELDRRHDHVTFDDIPAGPDVPANRISDHL
jgi:hypothetical protein